jgi:hypothetical protein
MSVEEVQQKMAAILTAIPKITECFLWNKCPCAEGPYFERD